MNCGLVTAFWFFLGGRGEKEKQKYYYHSPPSITLSALPHWCKNLPLCFSPYTQSPLPPSFFHSEREKGREREETQICPPPTFYLFFLYYFYTFPTRTD